MPCSPRGAIAGDSEWGKCHREGCCPVVARTDGHAASYFAPVSFTKPNRPSPQAGSEGGTGPTRAGHPGVCLRDPGKDPQDTPGPNWSDMRWWWWSPWKCPASGLEAMEGQGGEGPPRLGKEGGRSQEALHVLKVSAHFASVYHN